MSTRTNRFSILMPTDVFPPTCGGAGWSAHALALALIAQGHSVQALVPQRQEPGLEPCDILGVSALLRGYQAPNIPFILNYFRHERLWPVLANDLVHMARAQSAKATPLPGIIHAQHVQVAPAVSYTHLRRVRNGSSTSDGDARKLSTGAGQRSGSA